jgi:hypothetical protein
MSKRYKLGALQNITTFFMFLCFREISHHPEWTMVRSGEAINRVDQELPVAKPIVKPVHKVQCLRAIGQKEEKKVLSKNKFRDKKEKYTNL